MAEPREPPPSQAESIVTRVHADFATRLLTRLTQLSGGDNNNGSRRRTASMAPETSRRHSDEATAAAATPTVFDKQVANLLVLESCDVASNESPSRDPDGVSNFLRRLVDALRGAAVAPDPTLGEANPTHLLASHVSDYVARTVAQDAARQTDQIKTEFAKQVTNQFEAAAAIQAIRHTPRLLGNVRDCDKTPSLLSPKPALDFALSHVAGEREIRLHGPSGRVLFF